MASLLIVCSIVCLLDAAPVPGVWPSSYRGMDEDFNLHLHLPEDANAWESQPLSDSWLNVYLQLDSLSPHQAVHPQWPLHIAFPPNSFAFAQDTITTEESSLFDGFDPGYEVTIVNDWERPTAETPPSEDMREKFQNSADAVSEFVSKSTWTEPRANAPVSDVDEMPKPRLRMTYEEVKDLVKRMTQMYPESIDFSVSSEELTEPFTPQPPENEEVVSTPRYDNPKLLNAVYDMVNTLVTRAQSIDGMPFEEVFQQSENKVDIVMSMLDEVLNITPQNTKSFFSEFTGTEASAPSIDQTELLAATTTLKSIQKCFDSQSDLASDASPCAGQPDDEINELPPPEIGLDELEDLFYPKEIASTTEKLEDTEFDVEQTFGSEDADQSNTIKSDPVKSNVESSHDILDEIFGYQDNTVVSASSYEGLDNHPALASATTPRPPECENIPDVVFPGEEEAYLQLIAKCHY